LSDGDRKDCNTEQNEIISKSGNCWHCQLIYHVASTIDNEVCCEDNFFKLIWNIHCCQHHVSLKLKHTFCLNCLFYC